MQHYSLDPADAPITKHEGLVALAAALRVGFPTPTAAAQLKAAVSRLDRTVDTERVIGSGTAVPVIDGIDVLTQRLFVLLVGHICGRDTTLRQGPGSLAAAANEQWAATPENERKKFISSVQPVVLHLHTMQRRQQRPLADAEILEKVASMEVPANVNNPAAGKSLLDLLTGVPHDVRQLAISNLPPELPAGVYGGAGDGDDDDEDYSDDDASDDDDLMDEELLFDQIDPDLL